MKKTTIYIDIEDDIAAIVEKVSTSTEKIVALVLPKRPGVLQSSVNVRLLKRSADEASKNLVLITNDEQVMRLAGQTGVHVSPSLQSKPSIPKIDEPAEPEVDEISDGGDTSTGSTVNPAQPDVYADDKKIDPKTPVGDLVDGKEEDIELDNTEPEELDAKDADQKKSKGSKLKGIAVPNFSKFRTKLILGVFTLALLIGAGFWALVIAPKATVVLTTVKSESSTKFILTASTSTPATDIEQSLVPAVKKEDKQKLSGTFLATGTKDLGEKAKGVVTFYNCSKDDKLDDTARTVPAGTGISNGSRTFITQTTMTVQPSGFTGNNCKLDEPSGQVDVTASEGGDVFNLSPRTYSVAGFGTISAVDESGMSGGTTKVVKIVTDSDVELAKEAVLAKAADNVKGKVSQLLQDDSLIPIQETFVSEQGAPAPSIAVGGEATGDVTLTIEVTSSMLGIKLTDVDPFITKELVKQIDASKQKVYDTGALKATISIIERPNKDTVKINFAATSSIGPLLEQTTVATDISGKKAGEAKQLLESTPGVTRADVSLSPFWVFTIPTNTSKISVTVNE